MIDVVEPHLLAGGWTQLLGNWDSRTIGGHDFRKPGAHLPSPAAEARLASWNDAGLLRHAAAITTGARASAVVTHAGITSDWWFDTLGGEVDARQAVSENRGATKQDELGAQVCAARRRSMTSAAVVTSSATRWW